MELIRFLGRAATALALLAATQAFCVEKAPQPGTVTGTVVETMDAGSYTYVQVDTGKDKVWAAAPRFEVKVGEKVSFSSGMPMNDFESKTLNRKFKTVYFADSIEVPGKKAGAMPPNDAAHAGLHQPKASAAPLDFSGIKKADGGLSVAEVHQQQAKLANKPVTFRGKVVKYNSQIMNKNWVHVQDGTGTEGANDITVTTTDTAKVGDTVLVKGTVALKKDYGHGYKYDLVVENARLTVETAR